MKRIAFFSLLLFIFLIPGKSTYGKENESKAYALKQENQSGGISPGESVLIKTELRKILDRKEFRVRQDPMMTFWQRVGEKILFFIDLIQGRKIPGITVLFLTILIILIFIALWMIIFIGSSIKGRWVLAITPPQQGTRRGKLRNPDELKQKAENFAESGDFREAIRSLYQALLIILDRRGILEFEKSMTNWENLEKIKEKEEIFGPFQQFTCFFDEKWYGQKSCTIEDFRFGKRIFGEIISRC